MKGGTCQVVACQVANIASDDTFKQ